MKTQTIVGVAVMAVGTVVALATAGGTTGARLPLPQASMARHGSPAVRVSGARPGGTAAAAGTSLPSGADPPTGGTSVGATDPSLSYVSSPLVLRGCSVSVSDPAPTQGQTAETATVHTTAGTSVRLEADYVKTRSVHAGIADGSGTVSFALSISHAQPGFTVRVTATASLRGAKQSCSTSFTPVFPAGVFASVGGG